ncbi:MAG: hypothetical protein ABH871_02930 [Pseudomonadota bacterium]
MKKELFLILILTFFAIPLLVHANPPHAIHAKYDSVRQELNIIVQHPVTNPTEHFIKEVVIYKNGQEIKKEQFDFQTSRRNQSIPPIKIVANSGDEFRIVAICNKSGSGETTIQVN